MGLRQRLERLAGRLSAEPTTREGGYREILIGKIAAMRERMQADPTFVQPPADPEALLAIRERIKACLC